MILSLPRKEKSVFIFPPLPYFSLLNLLISLLKKNSSIQMQNGNVYLLWCIKCRNQICMLRHNVKTVYLCKTQDFMFFTPHNKLFFHSKSLQAIL